MRPISWWHQKQLCCCWPGLAMLADLLDWWPMIWQSGSWNRILLWWTIRTQGSGFGLFDHLLQSWQAGMRIQDCWQIGRGCPLHRSGALSRWNMSCGWSRCCWRPTAWSPWPGWRWHWQHPWLIGQSGVWQLGCWFLKRPCGRSCRGKRCAWRSLWQRRGSLVGCWQGCTTFGRRLWWPKSKKVEIQQ